MILCKYIDFEKGKTTIEDKIITVNDIDNFNDPFELKSFLKKDLTDPADLREALGSEKRLCQAYSCLIKANQINISKIQFIEKYKNIDFTQYGEFAELVDAIYDRMKSVVDSLPSVVKKFGKVTCFSDPRKIESQGDILMWSHYADRHRGLRIHFNIDDFDKKPTQMGEINYIKDIRVYSLKEYSKDYDHFNKDLSKIAFSKSDIWQYEQEYRLYFGAKDINNPSEKYKAHTVSIPRNSIIRIDLGCKCDEKNMGQILDIIKKQNYRRIRLCKAYCSEETYSIRYETVLNKK